MASKFGIEQVKIDALTAHPRNYRGHPDAQLSHLKTSLAEYDFAKPIVISRDNVILAGHGMVRRDDMPLAGRHGQACHT